MELILSQGGMKEKVVDVKTLEIADLWHIGMWLQDKANEEGFEHLGLELHAERILDVWTLAHDLKGALMCLDRGADRSRPVPTKVLRPKSDGSMCPYCGTRNIDCLDSSSTGDGSYDEEYRCEVCRTHWTQTRELELDVDSIKEVE